MSPAVVRGEHRGIAFTIEPRTPCPGVGWSIETFDHLGRRGAPHKSAGAFYDDCEDHPEGAYSWAEAACRRAIDRILAS